MHGTYGFPLSSGCSSCKFRAKGFFCQFSPAELEEFDRLKSVDAYPAGATLFIEQQKPRGIYLLCHGQVKLCLSSSRGKVFVLRTASAGEVLGLSSALSGAPFEVTAVAMQASQVAFVPRADFQHFLQQHPGVLQLVACQLESEYSAACRRLRCVALGASMFERVAQFLLAWADREGASENGTQFTVPLSHEQMAEFVGTTRESITRTLSALRKNGLIETQGGTFAIPNRAALERLRFDDAGSGSSSPQLVSSAPRLRHAMKLPRAVLKRAAGQ